MDAHRLWREVIAPRIKAPGTAQLTRAEGGISTEVYFVSLPDKDCALRVYAEDSLARQKGYAEAIGNFRELGFHTPEIIAQDAGWTLETRIRGKRLDSIAHEAECRAHVARLLARLHSHESRRYGKIGSLGGVNLSARWKQRFDERWRKITALFPEVEIVEDKVKAWHYDWAENYSPSRYQLLHGDIHPANLILAESGEICLLDCRSPKYGFGLVEVMEAIHYFEGEEPGQSLILLPEYLSHRDEETRSLYEHFAVSLHAVFHLRHADRCAGLACGARGDCRDHRRWERNALDSWLRYCELTGILSPRIDSERESSFQKAR